MTDRDTATRLVAVVGPTAVGKTALALGVAGCVPAEAVSADSRQIYRHMDIGTAKVSAEEREILPHHMVDVVDPDETLTLAQYLEDAKRAIADIAARGKLPLLVGGTGLYVRALLEGWTVPRVAPDPDFRARMKQLAREQGHEVLGERLAAVDPEAAERIDSRNVRRVIRALEVYQATGRLISELQRKVPPNWDVWTIGLTCPRELLYQRIDARVDQMIAQGLLDEVRWLLEHGYGRDLPAMSGLGYQQLAAYLMGEMSLPDAVQQIKRDTRNFVRKQYNWFRLSADWIDWYDVTRVDRGSLASGICAFARTGEHGPKSEG
ncbi:MAG: tRNA (adenosine(37)-N6)-dimethylallyltransferase MiaA [Anaerolineae bacterium]